MSMLNNKKNVLLSFPRSGNTWVRYIVESITGRPTIGYLGNDAAETDHHPLIHKDREDFILKKRHHIEPHWTKDNARIILLIRNYKEAVIRHYGSHSFDNICTAIENSNSGSDYICPINFYDQFYGDKILIYYTDLMVNTENEIRKIVNFLGCEHNLTDGSIDNFMSNIHQHIERSVEIYNETSPSYTKGKHVIFHSSQLQDIEKQWWDNAIKKRYPELYSKYLTRYEYSENSQSA